MKYKGGRNKYGTAKRFADKIRSNTRCKECGKQPIEYHDPTFTRHKDNYRLRVCYMVDHGRQRSLRSVNQ
jgi:hypothetical protein